MLETVSFENVDVAAVAPLLPRLSATRLPVRFMGSTANDTHILVLSSTTVNLDSDKRRIPLSKGLLRRRITFQNRVLDCMQASTQEVVN
jgi:hypothetical protein